MGRSYKKVPTIKNKKVIRVYRDETLDVVFSSETFKRTIKKEYEKYTSKLVSSIGNSKKFKRNRVQ